LGILLLLANFAVLGWQFNREIYGKDDGPVEMRPDPLPASVPRLQLMSELARLPEPRDHTTAEPTAAATPVPVKSEAVPVVPPPEAETAPEPEVVVTPPPSASPDPALVAEPSASATGGMVPEATADAAAPTTESAAIAVADVGTGSPAVAPPPPAPVARTCFSIGPFKSVDDRGRLRNGLPASMMVLREREEQRQERKNFWVYLEPAASDAGAEERLRDLKAQGVEDLLLIRKGEMKNAISLGVFRSQESVAGRLAEIKDRGYTPLVIPRYETRTGYWLDLAIEGDITQTSSGVDLPDGVERLALDCAQIAGVDPNP
jgi:hypothetical protein